MRKVPAKRLSIFLISICLILTSFFLIYNIFFIPILISSLFIFLTARPFEFLVSKKLNRTLSSILVIFLGYGIIILITSLLAPSVYEQLINLSELVISSFESWRNVWFSKLEAFILEYEILPFATFEEVVEDFDIIAEMTDRIKSTVTNIISSAPNVLGGVINIIMVPIITFFLMKDLPKLKSKLLRIIPVDLSPTVVLLGERINAVLKSVIKGQVTVALILSILYSIGFSIVGIKAALAIGIVAGICRVIPYLDVIVGATLSLVVITANNASMFLFLGILIVILVVQIIDGLFITPRVIGDRVGLHPLLVILSVIAFGDLFGFIGVLLAIPTVAIAKVLLRFFASVYLQSQFYNTDNPQPDRSQHPVI